MAEKDYREELIQAIRNRLVTVIDDNTIINNALDAVVVELNNYEVSERSTEVVAYDDTNEKIIKSFVACMIVEGRSPKTLRQYSYSLKRFFNYIGNKPYDQVNAYDVRAWLASLKMSGSKNVSVRNQKNNITPFFTWLHNDGVIAKNPCSPIRPIKVEDEEKSPFSSEEVDIIRSNCEDSRLRAIVETLLSSGLRVNELCNLKISDVDFNNLTVSVRCGKGGKDRTAFITPVAKRHIYIYLGDAKHKSEYLFTSNLDGKYSTSGIGTMMRRLSKKCGFHVHPHRFRRTLATDLARKGMPIQEIQKLLGHNSIETTRRYTETKIDKVQASYKQYIA